MKSALIIRGGAVGDFILTLPAIHAFRDRFPDTRLEILGYKHITSLITKRFYVEASHSVDRRPVAGFFAARGQLDQELSNFFASFDLIVSYFYDPDEIFVTNLKRAGAKKVIVADPRPTGPMHASEFLARWLSEIQIPAPTSPPRLYPSQEDLQEANRLFSLGDHPTIGLHIGSGSRTKNWFTRGFLELAAKLKEDGFQILVFEGPADSETATQFWAEAGSQGYLRCQNQPLPILAAVLKKCVAFVGHDSGVSHIAAAVETPTVALFGNTEPKVWAPRGGAVAIVKRETGISSITVTDVKTALEPYLKKSEK
jgi:heptosyltransferase III